MIGSGPAVLIQDLDVSAEWGFKHVTSSPTYPQSIIANEKAEATVKSMKNIIHNAWAGYGVDDTKLARREPQNGEKKLPSYSPVFFYENT